MPRLARALCLFATAASLPLGAARADEGMWTFDAFPTAKMQADYGWAPDQAWLDRVRGAAVRLTGGCSASFVSTSGLILTNHHCVASCLAGPVDRGQRSSREWHRHRRTRAEEKMCPGQQAEVVTAIARRHPRREGRDRQRRPARPRSRRAPRRSRAIEKAGCTDPATTRCQVVTPLWRRPV